MPDYTLNEIIDIVLVLEECHNNYRQAAVLYRNRFPHRRYPNHCTISRLVLRQRQRQRQKRQRRHINVPERDDPTVLAVLKMIAINPRVSTRQIERELGCAIVNEILTFKDNRISASGRPTAAEYTTHGGIIEGVSFPWMLSSLKVVGSGQPIMGGPFD
ncbi:hypothetical protein ALC57_17877 [Trachymyrmex cornetzi]|uniref:Uncharacterized protein n=1 Tax=Trachymyrmex cornetzi TaxID=471704 RepID=A0A151IT57_9HYME|nr:hypothetical protein ALC57_17877 [Trachymyrmex cornetzi]